MCHTVVPQFHDENRLVAQPKKKKKRRGTAKFLKAVSQVPNQLRSFSIDRRKLREQKRRRLAAKTYSPGGSVRVKSRVEEDVGGSLKDDNLLDRKRAAGDIRISTYLYQLLVFVLVTFLFQIPKPRRCRTLIN